VKLEYKFRILELSKDTKRLLIDLPSEYEIISTFLESDVQANPSFTLEALEKVLSGDSEYEELNGNICGLEIRKDKTLFFNNLDEEDPGNGCEIETNELRELIDIWISEVKRFK